MKISTPVYVSISPILAMAALLVALLPVTSLLGCGQLGLDPDSTETAAVSASPGGDGDLVAATLDGREITVAEIDEYMKNAFIEEMLSKPPAEVYENRNKGLQEMIQKQIIEEAAAAQGLDAQQLFEQVVREVKSPSPEEVADWYAKNQSRLGGAPLEQVAPRITEYLTNEGRGKAWSEFMNSKIEALDFNVVFEPPRLELEATRLVRGSAEATVTIMAFSDDQCPYCIRSEPVLAEVLSRYPDQVRIVHRHFPLDSIHPFARPAAEAAMCADEQGKFWEYHDAIFARGGNLSEASFAEIGSELGLDSDALGTCITERRYADFVQQDFDAGRAAGVTGTPAFFVNGVALKGSRDADQLSEVVDSELERIQVN
jgi:protein-disulfide isomerase/DNA-binding protein Fis